MLLFPDFADCFLREVDGAVVLGLTVVAHQVLRSVDPAAGEVIVYGELVSEQRSQIDCLQRVKVDVYGPSLSVTRDVARVLNSSFVGEGVQVGPGFFDVVRSDQGPALSHSPGLKSFCFSFDLSAVSRPV